MIRMLKWISKSFRNRTKSVDGSFDRYESSYPRVYESRLEDRRVLNAAAVIGVADLGSLRFDAGSQANDGGMDTFELSRISTSQDGKEIAVTINDRKVWQGSASQIGAIRFEGSSDVDQFLIDPSIQVGTGIFIDGGPFPLGSHDYLVLAAASDRVFQEIVYQTNEHSVELRFLESSSQPASTLHVQNVGDIDDRSVALNRHFDFSSTNPAWQLSGSVAAEGSKVTASRSLHLSNSEIGFRFESPSSNLTFDYRSTISGESTFVLKDIQLNELDRFEWLGRDSDSFLTSGEIELGRSLFVQSGSIRMNGSMHGNQSSIILDANRMLNISSAAAIRDAGGTFTATSPALFHSGRVDMGATGIITMDAGEGVLTIDGLLLSRGDDAHRGGGVFLLGDNVSVLNHSIVDVSGGKGGGQILVGGDERGSNPLIRNATHTSIATQAVLNADARILGNGGKIVVWANDTAVVDGSGNIRARGGALGGNGGWIETSGKRMLFVKEAANASAVNGLAGTWLLDPQNIEIVTEAPGSPAADTSYILVETINTALGLGTNTTLDTTILPGDFEGNITINAAIIAAPVASTILTLNANNNITFNAAVTGNAGTSMLSLNATAGNNVDASSVALSQLQSLSIIATGDVSLSTVTAGGTGQLISVKSGASKSIHLNGNLQTSGANVSLAGGKLMVDGTAVRQITTGSDAVNGGTVDLSGITTIDGETSIASLEIDTRGTSTAGSVSLSSVVASNQGLNQFLIETNSTAAGQVTLGDVRLVTKGSLAPSFVVQSGGTTILANGTIDLSTSGSGQTGGSVDLGASKVAPVNASSTLTILTSNSDAAGGDGGTVTLGGVSANGAAYFDQITIDTSATNTSATAGAINLANVANPSFTVDSFAVDGTSGTGITLIGRILNFFSGTLSLFTKPVSIGQDSSAIDLTKADFQTTGGLVFDTSDGNKSKVAGNVLLGDLGVSVQPSSLWVDTQGTTASGSLILNDGVPGITELHVAGDIDLTKTTSQLSDDVLLDVNADGSTLSLGNLTSSSARNLTLTSKSNISVGQVDLTSLSLVSGYKLTTGDTDVGSGILNVVFGQSTNQTDAKAQFQKITADRLEISGNSRVNDRVELDGAVAIGSGGILIQNYNDLDINATVRSVGSVIFVGGGLTVGVDVISTSGAVAITSSGGIAGSGAVAGTVVELTSRLDIGNVSAFKTRTESLNAQSEIGQINLLNTSADMATISSLKTVQGGPINIRQTGGGALNIQAIQTGALSLNGLPSNIGVINDSGSIAVNGQVSAGGKGSISLNASGDVILGSSARLETSDEFAIIQGVAGGQFQFISGAIVSAGSSDPATQAVLSKIPTSVEVSPITDAFGVSVSAEGVTTIEIRLGDTNPVIVDQNLAVKIFWEAGEVDDFTTGMLSLTTTNPNIARFDATGVPVRITHQYLDDPDLDPTSSIPINVEVGVDAKGRIQLSDSQGLDTRILQVIPVELKVPASWHVLFRFDLPQAPSASRPLVFDRILVAISTASTEVAPKLQAIESTSSESSADSERKFVLRLVTPMDESGRVSESKDVESTLRDVEDLNELFRRLPDNRYRIYMILRSGDALRIQDFFLRNHLPVEIDERIDERIEAGTNREPERNTIEGTSDRNANDSDRAETAIDVGAPVSLFDPILPETSDENSLDTNGSNVIPSVAAVSGSLLGANSISLRKAARRFRSH